jgi:hypothetical protein
VSRGLELGAKVELCQPLYGYEIGARGVVWATDARDPRAVLVKFDDTGHTMLVIAEALRPAA